MQRKKLQLPNPLLVSYTHLLRSETLLTRQPALLPGLWLNLLCIVLRIYCIYIVLLCTCTNASPFHRNGPEFEARIRQNEINNPKFNFLNPNDPYHAYYRHKVNEFKEGKAQEPSAAIPKVMQQQQLQQLPQKVCNCLYLLFYCRFKCFVVMIFCFCFVIGAVAGDSGNRDPKRATPWIWVHCRPPIHLSFWSGCCQAHCPVCCS